MPVDPARVNAVGDFVLERAEEFSALADPVRLRLFDLVGRLGPVTVPDLAEAVGESPALIEESLGQLSSIGLVDARVDAGGITWTSSVRGIYFEIPDDPEAQAAARALSNLMLARYASLPADWVREHEPELPLAWARAAGMLNARVALSAEELRTVQEQLERVLEPFTTRPRDDAPEGARPVRLLAFFLPETEQG